MKKKTMNKTKKITTANTKRTSYGNEKILLKSVAATITRTTTASNITSIGIDTKASLEQHMMMARRPTTIQFVLCCGSGHFSVAFNSKKGKLSVVVRWFFSFIFSVLRYFPYVMHTCTHTPTHIYIYLPHMCSAHRTLSIFLSYSNLTRYPLCPHSPSTISVYVSVKRLIQWLWFF